MPDQVLGPGGQPVKSEEQLKNENIQNSIQVIEGLYKACDHGTFPVGWAMAVMQGMQFLSQMHKNLVDQLPPELVEEIKKRNAPPTQPIPLKVVQGDANGQKPN